MVQNDSILKQPARAVKIIVPPQQKLHSLIIDESELREASRIEDRAAQQEATGEKTPGNARNDPTVRKREGIMLHPLTPRQPHQVTLSTEEQAKPYIILPERKFENHVSAWMVAVFILALVLLVAVRLSFNNWIKQLFIATVNESTAMRMLREKTVSTSYASFSLGALFYVVFSMFLLQTLEYVGWHVSVSSDIVTYLIIVAVVFVWFTLKKNLYLLTGFINNSIDETRVFLFNMNLFNHATGLLLLPVCLIIAFTPLAHPGWMTTIGIFIILFFYIMLILRGIKILFRKHFSIFYLILYLCTLELLPLLFVYKLVLK